MERVPSAQRTELKGFDIQLSLRPLKLSIRRGHTVLEQPNEPTIAEAQQRHAEFRARRPLFAQNDANHGGYHHALNRAQEEISEAREHIPNGRPMTPDERQEFGLELADILSFVFLSANYAGINLAQAWMTKMSEVEERYPEHEFQLREGAVFEEVYARVKANSPHGRRRTFQQRDQKTGS